MDLSHLQALLERVGGAPIACIGDIMVDRYVYGEVARISPEAPIPVLRQRETRVMLGAAGNVARNVAALGARVSLAAVIGDDAQAEELRGLVAAESGMSARLVSERGRRTTVKTRYVSSGQQLLRVDSEDDRPVTHHARPALLEAVEASCASAKVILISDYAKGGVDPEVMACCLEMRRRTGSVVIVDPKGDFARYGAADLIKPNARELAAFTNLPTREDAEVEAALGRALAQCRAMAILVTRAEQGMSLARRDAPVRHFRARPRTVFDVSGAGDTVLAALGLALSTGGSLDEAVELAVLASGVVVGKAGTAVVTASELVEAELSGQLAPAEAKIAVLSHAAEAVAGWRRAGMRIGFTNGCFDILHRGHVAYLAKAREWCDRLIVGMNSDESVRRLKGEGRPVNTLESRALVLASLSSVDLVVAFDAPTPIQLIEAIRPDVLVKGADYSIEAVVGADLVRAYGGEVRLAPIVEGFSTTAAISRMARPAPTSPAVQDA